MRIRCGFTNDAVQCNAVLYSTTLHQFYRYLNRKRQTKNDDTCSCLYSMILSDSAYDATTNTFRLELWWDLISSCGHKNEKVKYLFVAVCRFNFYWRPLTSIRVSLEPIWRGWFGSCGPISSDRQTQHRHRYRHRHTHVQNEIRVYKIHNLKCLPETLSTALLAGISF